MPGKLLTCLLSRGLKQPSQDAAANKSKKRRRRRQLQQVGSGTKADTRTGRSARTRTAPPPNNKARRQPEEPEIAEGLAYTALLGILGSKTREEQSLPPSEDSEDDAEEDSEDQEGDSASEREEEVEGLDLPKEKRARTATWDQEPQRTTSKHSSGALSTSDGEQGPETTPAMGSEKQRKGRRGTEEDDNAKGKGTKQAAGAGSVEDRHRDEEDEEGETAAAADNPGEVKEAQDPAPIGARTRQQRRKAHEAGVGQPTGVGDGEDAGGDGGGSAGAGVAAGVVTWEAHVNAVLTDADLERLQAEEVSFRDVPDDLLQVWPGSRWQLSGGRDGGIAAPPLLAQYGIKERLVARWREVHKEEGSLPAGSDFVDARQHALFALLSSRRDVALTQRTYPGRGGVPDGVTDAYLLHALNAVAHAADSVKRNSDRMRGREGADAALDVPRDQGFTRARVLILLPLRNRAYEVVRRLVVLALRETRADTVRGKEKFLEHYGDLHDSDEEGEGEEAAGGAHVAGGKAANEARGGKRARRKPPLKPEDHRAIFRGNVDDHFRLGIKITRGAIRLFADVLESDVVVASPLALATMMAEDPPGGAGGAADFLSSIELLVVDHADVIAMQNWEHLCTVLRALNRVPRELHGVDVMRVRAAHLSGAARHYRQSLLLAAHDMPELRAVACGRDMCAPLAGHARLVSTHAGVLARIVPQVRQTFERFVAPSPADLATARLDFFKRVTWPQLREGRAGGLLIFVSHYFDYVRLRNFLSSEGASFSSVCEYTSQGDTSRARAAFAQRQVDALLYTERAHFYHRYKLRGVRGVVFYSLPVHPHFYTEVLAMRGAGDVGVAGGGALSLFSAFDALALTRIVGSSRAAKMVRSKHPTFVFC